MYNFIEIEDKELENIEDDFFENKSMLNFWKIKLKIIINLMFLVYMVNGEEEKLL